MKILALDVGEKRVGIAISDEMAIIASPLETVSFKDSLLTIQTIINENEIEKIVVGYPRQMDGSLSEKAAFVDDFLIKLAESFPGKKIETEDETGTSVLAEERLKKRGVNFRVNKGEVDKEAAAIILQAYLDDKRRITN